MAANGVACVLGGRRPHPFVAVTVSFLWGIVCSKSLLVLSREGWNDPQWLSNNNPSNPHSHPFPTFSTRISASDGCMRQVCRRDSDGKQEVGGLKVEAASASWKSRVKRSQWIWIIYMYRDIYIYRFSNIDVHPYLVGGLDHVFFHSVGNFTDPNWRTPFFRLLGMPPTRKRWGSIKNEGHLKHLTIKYNKQWGIEKWWFCDVWLLVIVDYYTRE